MGSGGHCLQLDEDLAGSLVARPVDSEKRNTEQISHDSIRNLNLGVQSLHTDSIATSELSGLASSKATCNISGLGAIGKMPN